MAVWADFDEDDEPSLSSLVSKKLTAGPSQLVQAKTDNAGDELAETGPSAYIAHALRCYPVAERLAEYLDLTDLDSLSSTCRLVRESLIQFAHQLKQHSLRCSFEAEEKEPEDDFTLALQLSLEDELGLGTTGGPAFPINIYSSTQPTWRSGLGLSGKISRCARDLVAPCRRCGTVVCRNCTEKAPSNRYLTNRLRRLCDACIEAPLILHKAQLQEPKVVTLPTSSASSTKSERSDSTVSEETEVDYHHTAQTLSELPDFWLRDPCTCATQGVYLCHQCGHNTRGADDIYQRVWKWRSRYSTHLGGGLGTGLGLGNQGQKCGRGKYCLATRDAMALMESECSEDILVPGGHDVSRSNTPVISEHETETRPEPGYFRQEIEGIGGKVKSKSKKLVKVGATVYEYRDERESGKYLGREASGELRSWCSWCSRVCPGKQERMEMASTSSQ